MQEPVDQVVGFHASSIEQIGHIIVWVQCTQRAQVTLTCSRVRSLYSVGTLQGTFSRSPYKVSLAVIAVARQRLGWINRSTPNATVDTRQAPNARHWIAPIPDFMTCIKPDRIGSQASKSRVPTGGEGAFAESVFTRRPAW